MANKNITTNMCENNIFKYLCPTLISERDILEELKANGIKIKGLERKDRNELTEIYIKHIMPMPQRTFPNNHQGKLINKIIQSERFLSKTTDKTDNIKSNLQYGFNDKNNLKSTLTLGGGTSSGDRLKPPINSSSLKTQKISLSKSPSSSSNSSLDKIIIKDRSKERKNSSESDGPTSNSEDKDIKKMDLKRSLSTESNEDSSPSKKSRQKIAWP